MGQWVIFIGNAMFGPDTIRAMAFKEKVEIRDDGEKQFDVLFKENHDAYVSFQFDYDGMIMSDYSPEELKNLPFRNPQFILLRYSDIKLLERIISADDFPKDILIDCDGVDLGLEKSQLCIAELSHTGKCLKNVVRAPNGISPGTKFHGILRFRGAESWELG